MSTPDQRWPLYDPRDPRAISGRGARWSVVPILGGFGAAIVVLKLGAGNAVQIVAGIVFSS